MYVVFLLKLIEKSKLFCSTLRICLFVCASFISKHIFRYPKKCVAITDAQFENGNYPMMQTKHLN
ncbi:hypothetical protein T4B_14962 [Trichinella pseudospiralis]|uniref:Uncharacterized protein n=1 Tax=Trichinella pseudospiralis TaxID=6337 RepID=A0A0V1IDV8_TRIPS|nr:hypothetical protein T4B_14962 [Trichinella pseudospiralis]